MPSTIEALLRQNRRRIERPAPKPRRDEEHQHQAALIEWALLQRMPALPGVEPGTRVADYLFAIPNAGKRTWPAAGRLRAEGMKSGVWDLMLPVPVGGWHGLWLEMKSSKGVLETDQKAWGARMAMAGYSTSVCRSVDAAKAALMVYLDLP